MEIDTKIVDECAKSIHEGLKTQKRGLLIVFEGVDGSGKTTQLNEVKKWCDKQNYPAVITSWRGSKLIGSYLENLQAKGVDLVPEAFSLANAADLAYRIENEINPALRTGKIVLCDRYYYTGIVRDTTLGLNKEWVKNRYDFTIEPDLVLYFDTPVDVSLDRLIKRAIEIRMNKKKKGKGKKGKKIKGTIAGTIAGTIGGTIGGPIGVLKEGVVDSKTIFKNKEKEKEYYDFMNKVRDAYEGSFGDANVKTINGVKPIPLARNEVIENISNLICNSWK
ncbi:dTMP kinase [Candidatus Altiarchaeales archaeon WOR_SM1_SCG]|nr:dTMP kinase [Candidatus Altiarchaeales archaeon WOR_SM1_SCG]